MSDASTQVWDNTMSKYTCTRCGSFSCMPGKEQVKNVKCCDGDNPVKHVIGHIEIKKPENLEVKAPTPVEVPNDAKPQPPQVMNPSAPVGSKSAVVTKPTVMNPGATTAKALPNQP